MFTPMSSWLESVMIAFAPCCFTSCKAPARAISGAFPEFASATSNRTVLPDCFSAWFICPTARRIDSAQLGVAIDPVRSMSCPTTIVVALLACCESAAGLQAAAQTAKANRKLFVTFIRVSKSRGLGSRRGRHDDPRTARMRKRRFDLRGDRSAGDEGERKDESPCPAASGTRVVPRFPGEVLRIELHVFPRSGAG